MTGAVTPPPGWYPDPWFVGQHRYWTGTVWAANVFPDSPAAQVQPRPEGQRPTVPPPTQPHPSPAAPTFGYEAQPAPMMTATLDPWEVLGSHDEPRERRRLSRRQLNVLALALGLVIGFVAVAVTLSRGHGSNAAAGADPSVLRDLVVRQSDVAASNSVTLLDHGDQVTGQPTLDLCNGTFATESARTARLQVVEDSADGSPVLSTEAVLYRHPDDGGRAMRELQAVVDNCPNGVVVSPVGEPPVTTRFQQPPDGSWPDVSGVDRQAYAFTTIDALGMTDDHIAVYLRRGRVLEGLYFTVPSGAQAPVDGQTTIPGIVNVFAQRIAALPGSVTG